MGLFSDLVIPKDFSSLFDLLDLLSSKSKDFFSSTFFWRAGISSVVLLSGRSIGSFV